MNEPAENPAPRCRQTWTIGAGDVATIEVKLDVPLPLAALQVDAVASLVARIVTSCARLEAAGAGIKPFSPPTTGETQPPEATAPAAV